MSGLSVCFLGSGDAFGSGGRLQMSVLVDSEAGRLLLDCGTSSLIGMRREGIDPTSIDGVLITHLHGDHFGGLPFLVLDAQFSGRERPLVIAGPPGIEQRVLGAMEALFPGSSSVQRRFGVLFMELPERHPTPVGEGMVTAFPVVHASGAPSYALRVELGERTTAYSGDTEWTDSLIEASKGVDLFICEAYFYDKAVKFHLDYQTLMRHRDELSCRRLILAHMSSSMLDWLDDIDVEAAFDGLRIEL